VTINLQGPIMAVVGANGTGKTTAIEAFFAGLYGFFPSRGAIGGCIMPGASGADILCDFALNGQQFRILREFSVGKQTTQRAYVNTVGETLDAIVGPKVTDVNKWVAANVGPDDVALATWFSAQGSKVGDLCDADPAARRAVFAELLGLGNLEKRSARYGEARKKTATKIETLETRLGEPRDWDAEIAAVVVEVTDAGRRHGTAKADATLHQSDIDAATRKLGTIGNSKAVAEGLRREAVAANSALAAANGKHSDAVKRLADFQNLAKFIPDYEAAGKRAAETREEIEGLEADGLTRVAYQAWDTKRETLRAAYSETIRVVETLEGMPGVTAEERTLAAEGPALRAQLDASEAHAKEIRAANSTATLRMQSLASEQENLERERANLQRRIDARPVTPGPQEDCERCPLLRDFALLPYRLAEINDRLAAIAEERANVPALQPEADLAPLREKLERARAAYAAVKSDEQLTAKIEKAKDARTAATQSLQAFSETEPPKGRVVAVELRAANDALRQFEAQAAKLPDAIKARDSIHEAQAAVDAALAASVAAQEAAGLAESKATEAEGLAAAEEPAIAELNATIAKLKADKAAAEAVMQAAIEEKTRLAAKHERLHEDQEKDAKARAEITALREQLGLETMLQEAFGKKGIQAILMDRAAPELEAISQDMLDRVTGGRMRMRLATQRINADQSIAEDFQIVVTKEDGEGDIAMCSGGEQRMLRTILRLAVARWMGKLQGQRPTCLFIDEGFDALDADNRPAMVQLLADLASDYELVVVITHEPSLAAQMPHRVTLARRFGSVMVEAAYKGLRP